MEREPTNWLAAAAHAEGGAIPSARIASLFAAPVAAFELRDMTQAAALPADAAMLPGAAVPKRRLEFAAGRACACHALAALGADGDAALVHRPGHGPLWPRGYRGSISHTRELCGAVACRSDAAASLGLDLEYRAPLEEAVLQQIASTDERAWLAGQPDAASLALALFCAKEAFYKCQHPLTSRWLDFHDVSLRLHHDGRIELLRVSAGSGSWIYHGRYRIEADHVLSGFQAQPA